MPTAPHASAMPPGDGASQVQAPYPMRLAASFVAARISSWEPMMSDFVHLHCHTEFSLLDGAIKINELVKKAKALGMPATAITDHGNLFGTSYFYAACKDMGIAPIIGCEAYVTPDHFDKASELAEDLRRKVTVKELMDETGWDEDKIRSAIKFSGDNIEDLDSGEKKN